MSCHLPRASYVSMRAWQYVKGCSNYDCYFIAHNYQLGYKKEFENININEIKTFKLSEVYEGTKKFDQGIVLPSGQIAHGHITVHKDVFDKLNIKYNNWRRAQDSKIDNEILRALKEKGYSENSVIIIQEKLSKYIPNAQQYLE